MKLAPGSLFSITEAVGPGGALVRLNYRVLRIVGQELLARCLLTRHLRYIQTTDLAG